MKIAFLGNFNNQANNKIEESMSYVLRDMGHEVLEFDEKDFNKDDIINADADILLFFKGGTGVGEMSVDELVDMLYKVPYTKVCWYFDKVWGARIEYMMKIAPVTDFVFLTDGTFVRRHNYINFYELKQAIDAVKPGKGKYKKEFDVPIVFPGTIYGQRKEWAEYLKHNYGDAFQIVNGIFDSDLEDLCESAKVFVAPKYPQDNHYWSNRIYQVIGRGGFLIHPYLTGLAEEFEDGEHLVFYRNPKEMIEKINYYLQNDEERERIREKGQKHCLENHTYYQAFNQLFNKVYGEKTGK